MTRRVRVALALLVVAAAACGEKTPPAGPGPTPAPADATPAEVAPADAAAVTACVADQSHCCMPDGALVVPGGCQPSFPDHVQPNVERAADGSCRQIPCTLRCLPEDARIATPRGEVAVSRLRVGDPVWTVDARGARIEARVARVQALPVLAAHALVEHTLADGRVVRASAGHPDGAGASFGALAAGAALDGSTIVATRVVPYTASHTWDLLPEGATGQYWADGVRIGSTLAP